MKSIFAKSQVQERTYMTPRMWVGLIGGVITLLILYALATGSKAGPVRFNP